MKDICQLLCLLNNSVLKICSLYQRWHENGVLRVKNEKFSKITLTKTEVNIMVIVGTILISVGASILFVLKVNSVKDI